MDGLFKKAEIKCVLHQRCLVQIRGMKYVEMVSLALFQLYVFFRFMNVFLPQI